MRADGLAIELPPNPMPYLVDWLMECGPLVATGMGNVPLGWGDIHHWQDLTGSDPNPWEARTLRRLSRAYHEQMHQAKKPTCPAPYATAVRNDAAVDRQFEQMFRRMAANKKKG